MNVGLELETVKSFANLDSSGRIDFQGCHDAVGALKNVSGFPSRRRAGVKHALSWLDVQQMCGKLSAGILNGAKAGGKAWNSIDGNGGGKFDGVGADAAGFKLCALQQVKIILDGREAGIDAQRHRRMTGS